MMRYGTRWTKVSLFATILLAIAGMFANANSPDSPGETTLIKDIEVGSQYIAFFPIEENGRLAFQLTGPGGFRFHKVFDRGEPPHMPLFYEDGERLCDGVYNYSVKVDFEIPKKILEMLEDARAADDGRAIRAILEDAGIPTSPAFQTGSFSIMKGEVMIPKPVGGSDDRDEQTRDFLINDDLIVDGSACIGFDCVNGESFGFDTLRLKENNLRIKFDDTSVAGSFPRNDWQITANDSANGGASKFSIDDISGNRTPFTIEANARSHSLYVDDGGRIGNRTSTPSADFHSVDGDTPTLRLQQDGSSGFAPQTWDLAGNETNFFIRDVSNGSTLPLRVRPGSATSTVDIQDGGVSVGHAGAPNGWVHVKRTDGTAKIVVEDASSTAGTRTLLSLINEGAPLLELKDTGGMSDVTWQWSMNNSDDMIFSLAGSGATEMRLTSAGEMFVGGALVQTSDREKKENFDFVDTMDVLKRVSQVPLLTWNYKADPNDHRHLGPMAQDFYAAFELGSDDKHIASLDLSSVAVAGVQGLYQLNLEKDQKIEDLERKNAELEERLKRLEAIILKQQ